MTSATISSDQTPFSVVPDAYCDSCGDMPHVFQCVFCALTFCNSCTDLDAWLDDAIKACPHCGHISAEQSGNPAAVTAAPTFLDSTPKRIIATGNLATLRAARLQHGFTVILCDVTQNFTMEENHEVMQDLDRLAVQALEQFAVYVGLPMPDDFDIYETPLTLRVALSNAAVQSPSWSEHHKVSKWLLHHLNIQLGKELADLINPR